MAVPAPTQRTQAGSFFKLKDTMDDLVQMKEELQVFLHLFLFFHHSTDLVMILFPSLFCRTR